MSLSVSRQDLGVWASGPQAPRVLGIPGEDLGAGAPYQELQPPQQPVQPGLQGPQLGLQGPQGRAARPAQPLHVPQVGEQVGPKPCQHARELGGQGVRGSGAPGPCPAPIPRDPLPGSYLQGSQRACAHGQGGQRVQVVVPVGWEFVSLGGGESFGGGPAQLWVSPHPLPTSLKRPLPWPRWRAR